MKSRRGFAALVLLLIAVVGIILSHTRGQSRPPLAETDLTSGDHTGTSPHHRITPYSMSDTGTTGTSSQRNKHRFTQGTACPAAVTLSLDWLKRHQAADGSWEGDVRATSMALLAFFAQGETSQFGPHRDTMAKGIAWLKRQQAEDGLIGPRESGRSIREHAMAAMALAEGVGMGEPGLAESAQKATDYLVHCQIPGMGWKHDDTDRMGMEGGSMDATIWALIALKSASIADLQVPKEAFQGANALFDKTYSGTPNDGKGTFGYSEPNNFIWKRPQYTTAMGVLGRELLGNTQGVGPGSATLIENLPNSKDTVLTYCYFGSLALFQKGGEEWAKWAPSVQETLSSLQKTTGDDAGAWEGDNFEGGGQTYNTALGTLCLSVYYRYRKGMGLPPNPEPGGLSPVP